MAAANNQSSSLLLLDDQILVLVEEAQHRWLRPSEICHILTSNYATFQLRPSPPIKPPAGSLCLYDRKLVRYFRNDGYNWRKKKDAKTVKEAHEKLKIGSVDVLHCYYAHGQDNHNFQRRSYWMLDKQLENIVLVHYREVKEGYNSSVPSMLNVDPGTLLQPTSSDQTIHTSYNSLQHSTSDTAFSAGSPFSSEFAVVTFNPDSDSHLRGSVSNPFTDGDIHSQDFFGTGLQQLHAGSEPIGSSKNGDVGGLNKLDSFGRWMDEEMGGDSLVSTNYWNALKTEKHETKVSSLSHHHMHLGGPSFAKDQLFSICDFAPDWAYAGTKTKVLIIGNFLGDKIHMSGMEWCCMFGQTEVAAEIVTENTIRCQVPFHGAGRVPFYITCKNRLACSEVHEFEYVKNPSSTLAADSEDEFGLLVRLSKVLYSGTERKWLGCLVVNCEKCKLKDAFYVLIADKEKCWKRIMEVFKGNCKEVLIQNMLKDKLFDWLLYEAHNACEGLRMLDEKGEGIIHLVAALGFEWAIGPIVAAGLSPNFKDARGRTALHWASLYGREETVVALVKLGVSVGAVDHPTPSNQGGQTAAELALIKGHKWVAGYLVEADHTSMES